MSRDVLLRASTRRHRPLGALVDHDQGVVAERGADLDALGAALAVDGVDEEAEGAAVEAATRRAHRRTSPCRAKCVPCRSAALRGLRLVGGEGLDARLRAASGWTVAEDRGVGARADAGHAPDAGSAMNCGMRGARPLKSRVAEVPGGRRSGDAGVRRQLVVGDAAPIRRTIAGR